MTSSERSAIENQVPGEHSPGTGDVPSTGKNSKPADGPSPSPDGEAATGRSTAEPVGSGNAENAENADPGLAADEQGGGDSSPAPPVAVPAPGDVAGTGGAAGGDDAALSDSTDGIGPSKPVDGRAAPAAPADVPAAEGDVDELTKTQMERDKYLALAQRTQADFENFRKRTARDAKLAEARGVVRLVKELLPALDNLGRALSAAAQDDPLLAGVRLVHEDLAAALRRYGVESYSPEGERFDPAQHEAMVQQPVEGVESGTVIEVYQAGYRLDGTVIRPARVVVAA